MLPTSRRRRARGHNLVLYSESIATAPWATTGAPDITPAAHTASGVSLDLLADDDGAGYETAYQAIAFPANGQQAISLHMKKGTDAHAGGSFVELYDATADADRLMATVQWDGNGVPSVTMATGTYLGADARTDGVYRLFFRSLSLVAANTIRLYLYATASAAATGNVYVGGVQAEPGPTPSTYTKTTATAIP